VFLILIGVILFLLVAVMIVVFSIKLPDTPPQTPAQKAVAKRGIVVGHNQAVTGPRYRKPKPDTGVDVVTYTSYDVSGAFDSCGDSGDGGSCD
jgi:hypothetical protein